jgi:protocatechuate 3,4-dioxygenase beta subunit
MILTFKSSSTPKKSRTGNNRAVFCINGSGTNPNKANPMPVIQLSESLFARATLGIAALILLPPPAYALILGGTGNEPLRDPGWPKEAAGVFNHISRVAYWEGPPLGGGEWHAECRGDAADFNEVLAQFAKIDATKKRLVIHDGEGRSFWLNPNNAPDKRAAAAIDWVFVVWQSENWKRLQSLPAGLRARGNTGAGEAPAPQIDVYTAGRIKWGDVKVPKGIEVIDHRLEAHGFSIADGIVLEGTIHDLGTGRPLKDVTVELQRIEPQPKGGYQYTSAAAAATDVNGHWVLRSVPAGWYQITARADAYAPRIVGHGNYDNEPLWQAFDAGLTQSATVRGRVTDDEGQPLSGVDVRLDDVVAKGDGGSYSSPSGNSIQTDADGRFTFAGAPIGRASVWVNKPGYVRPGLGVKIETPADDVSLTMIKAAALEVTVDFTGTTRPEGYIVEVAPEGGEAVGKWGGSGNINAEGTITYKQIPPGKYVVTGRPNPGKESDRTEPQTVDLLGGETTKIMLHPK